MIIIAAAFVLLLRLPLAVEGVVGGIMANGITAASSVILLNRGFNQDPTFCSGAIISTRHVLTNARCCFKTTDSQLVITGGSIKTYDEHAEDYYVEDFHAPDETEKGGVQIMYLPCVIKVSRKIKYNEHLYPVGLASQADINRFKADGKSLLGLGYGQIQHMYRQWEPADYLNYLELPVQPFDRCQNIPRLENVKENGGICLGETQLSGTPKRLGHVDVGGPLVGKLDQKIYGFACSYLKPSGMEESNEKQYPMVGVLLTAKHMKLIEKWLRM